MERKQIIIIALIVVIVALLVGMVAMMVSNTNKKDTKLTFKSKSTINEGGSLKIKLTDKNGNAIANQTVNVTVTDKDKSNSYYSVSTNNEGTGNLKLDKSSGKYTVVIRYDGNDRFNGCNSTKKITIEDKGTDSQSSSRSVYAYKSDGTPMYSQEEVNNYVQSKYGSVNYHIQDNGYINLDDAGYTDDGAVVVKGGVRKDGKVYERSFYENYIMGK